jgi:hypothetical protein
MELQQSKGVKDFTPLTDDDSNFDRKLDAVTAGGSYVKEHLLINITRKNCKIIVDYVLAMQTEEAPLFSLLAIFSYYT